MTKVKTYYLIDPKTGANLATLKNRQPRKAAVKCAKTGHKTILLREAGSMKGNRAARIHEFEGDRKLVEFKLPYPAWVKLAVEKKAGKKIPDELNQKGKEALLKTAGFSPYLSKKGNVRKVCVINVPKTKGAEKVDESIKEWLKTRK